MIYLPEIFKRTFDRIEEIYRRDIAKGERYCSSITRRGTTYYGTDTVRVYLDMFREFREDLEKGTSPLLQCEDGYEEVAKVKLMHAVWDFYEPLSANDVYWVNNDVYASEELIQRLTDHAERKKTKKEAESILDFIKEGYCSRWGQGDEHYKVRDFRLVTTVADFEEVLKEENAEELTGNSMNLMEFNTIRVALVPIERTTIYKKKGIMEDYIRFTHDLFQNPKNEEAIDDGLKVWDIWHDVRATGIYYVYVPKARGRKSTTK